MEQVTNDLDSVFQMFVKRQSMYDDLSESIVQAIKPTVLDAVVEVLEVQYDKVTWLDINFYDYSFEKFEDAVLMISCVVEYDNENQIPALMYQISPQPDPDTDDMNKRMVRVGVPFEFVMQSKEDIKMMLYRTLLGDLQHAGPSEDDLWDSIVQGAEDMGITKAHEPFDHVGWLEKQTKGKLH